jgi:hypothetical protein
MVVMVGVLHMIMNINSLSSPCMQALSLAINLECEMYLIVNVAPRLLAHRLKERVLAIRKLAMQSESDARSNKCGARWRRMLLRVQQRAAWHFQGIVLWLVQRPELRFLPFPYVSVKCCADWVQQLDVMKKDSIWPRRHLQLAASKMSLSRLGDCLHLRDRVGFKMAFLEDTRMTAMIGSLTGFHGQKVAVHRALQQEIQENARAQMAQGRRDQCVKELIGPRGGLPSLKADLVKLATLLHVPVLEKDRVEDLKKKLTPAVALMMSGTAVPRSTAGRLAAEAAAASKSSQPMPKAKQPPVVLVPTVENLRNYVPPVSYGERMGVLEDDPMETQSELERRINGEHQWELQQEHLEAHWGPLDQLSAEDLNRIQTNQM